MPLTLLSAGLISNYRVSPPSRLVPWPALALESGTSSARPFCTGSSRPHPCCVSVSLPTRSFMSPGQGDLMWSPMNNGPLSSYHQASPLMNDNSMTLFDASPSLSFAGQAEGEEAARSFLHRRYKTSFLTMRYSLQPEPVEVTTYKGLTLFVGLPCLFPCCAAAAVSPELDLRKPLDGTSASGLTLKRMQLETLNHGCISSMSKCLMPSTSSLSLIDCGAIPPLFL